MNSFDTWIQEACNKLDEQGCRRFKDISQAIKEQGATLKNGDYDYVHRKDGTKVKLGKYLKKLDPQLAADYGQYKQQLKYKKKGLVLHISQNPEDILAKSTGQGWTSCATVGGGGMDVKGIFDDIKANNAIAYITPEDQPNKWLGRRIIRWCIREDNKQPDAVIEKFYGDPNYSDLTYRRLQEILREKRFSGVSGETYCVTPYKYRGYVDSGSKDSENNINYRVGGLP